jgi:hypothetical protein
MAGPPLAASGLEGHLAHRSVGYGMPPMPRAVEGRRYQW